MDHTNFTVETKTTHLPGKGTVKKYAFETVQMFASVNVQKYASETVFLCHVFVNLQFVLSEKALLS